MLFFIKQFTALLVKKALILGRKLLRVYQEESEKWISVTSELNDLQPLTFDL